MNLDNMGLEDMILAHSEEKIEQTILTYTLYRVPYENPDPKGTASKRNAAVKRLIEILYKNPKTRDVLSENLRKITLTGTGKGHSKYGIYTPEEKHLQLNEGMLTGTSDELFTLTFLHELGHAINSGHNSDVDEVMANITAINLIGMDQYKSLADKGLKGLRSRLVDNIRKAITDYESRKDESRIQLSPAKQQQVWRVYMVGLGKS
jgi:hypothetical protein